MLKAYKFRIYPTSEQKVLLAKSFGCSRWFFNWALQICYCFHNRISMQPSISEMKVYKFWREGISRSLRRD
ncbi:helix-turn-helix domain-containing protein [Oxynema sp. CENA135]|uniref:helix-turn-helix domain-containing protein n=1 Tax=Oxynema sp. CENA135 TaxID=984206 RepID=UPI00351C044D